MQSSPAAAPPAAAPLATAVPSPAGAPPAAADSAPLEPAADQATLHDLSGVASAAALRELSDGLGVSSALYLGASDLLRLKAMIEQPDDETHALRVLRRLSTVRMTGQLNAATHMLACLAELSADARVRAAAQAGVEEAVEAAALLARITSAWKAQLEEEQRQRDAQQQRNLPAAVPARKEKRKDPNCIACQGRHRPHTCK